MFESFKKNGKGILLMMLSSLFVCFGQLMWKLASIKGDVYLFYGFISYALGALIMVVAYKFGKLSVLQPMLSLNYIISLILAKEVLNESITLKKMIGILIIILGVILVGGGDD